MEKKNTNLIYVCDDEKDIADLIKMYLESSGYMANVFNTGEDLLKAVEKKEPDLITLDIMLPGADGFSVLEKMRKKYETPVILISAKDEEIDKVRGFNAGSDDYIVKPFMPLELVARVKNILKRLDKGNNGKEKNKTIEFANLVLNKNTMEVIVNNKVVTFTKIEYKFLEYLLENKDRAITKKEILEQVWEYDEDDSRVIDDLLKRFRKKLDMAKANIEIETIRGVGYRVKENIIKKGKKSNEK